MDKIKSIFTSYMKSLLKYSNNNLYDYYIDTQSGHLFNRDSNMCECELFEKQCNSIGKIELLDNNGCSNVVVDFKNYLIKCSNKDVNIIDCYESKLNVLRVTKNILSTVFQIGVFISG